MYECQFLHLDVFLSKDKYNTHIYVKGDDFSFPIGGR